jgi:beta-glucosidase
VLNIGGVIETESWKDKVDAILLCWQPGLEAGNAVVDLLSGKVNPSGKLATTFPVQYDDVPSAKYFPGKEFPDQATKGNFGQRVVPAEVTYEEGIYVGYRYYNTFNVTTSYPFGYGLSYTSFTYQDAKINSKSFNGKVIASVTIVNTGKVAGKEVVQLYVHAPGKDMNKPAAELRGFAKTNLLQPGKSQTISFEITSGDLASFDTKAFSWIAEKGDYRVTIGSSSTNVKEAGVFNLAKDIVVEKCNKAMSPQVAITELKN